MPVRGPSPAHLFLALLFACLAPVAVVVATGLSGPADDKGDTLETADGDDRGRADARSPAAAPGAEGGPSTTARPSTTTSTTAAPPTTAVAPTTAPPSTAPPTTAAPPPPAPPPPSADPPAPSVGDVVVALVNASRADAGCGALRADARLTVAAQGHSDDMADQGYFSHTSLDGRTFADRVRAAGYPSPGGENIAQGQRSAQAVHDAWMSSEGHRANILNCGFTAIGVGLNRGAWTWTQNFGY